MAVYTCTCILVASFGALMYGPRVCGQPWVISTPRSEISLAQRHRRLEEFISIVERRRAAIFILISIAIILYTPCKVFSLTLIIFGGAHLLYNFLCYL